MGVTEIRWTPRRKAAVVLMVDTGLFSLAEACEKYKISEAEFQTWADSLNKEGVPGLRVSRYQIYKLENRPKRRYRRRITILDDDEPRAKSPEELFRSKIFRY